jgi:hypothetical protein
MLSSPPPPEDVMVTVLIAPDLREILLAGVHGLLAARGLAVVLLKADDALGHPTSVPHGIAVEVPATCTPQPLLPAVAQRQRAVHVVRRPLLRRGQVVVGGAPAAVPVHDLRHLAVQRVQVVLGVLQLSSQLHHRGILVVVFLLVEPAAGLVVRALKRRAAHIARTARAVAGRCRRQL